MIPTRRITRGVALAVGAAAAAATARGVYELYGFRVDIETHVDVDDALPVDGWYGTHRSGEPIVLGVMGDSLACGKGASTPERSVAALLARKLSEHEDRPVRLYNVARSGGSTRHLELQARALADRLDPGEHCDVVYVSVGAIDVSNSVTWGVARADLRTCLHDLTRTGARVVVSMPDRASGATSFDGRPLLSAFCDSLMRRRAAKQSEFLEWFATAGYHVRAADVSEVTRAFAADPATTSDDLVHPSDSGQEVIAAAMFPQLSAALHDDRPAHPSRSPA